MPKFLSLTACLSAIIISSTPTAALSLPFSENQTIENLSQKAKLEISKITGIAVNRLTIVNKATLANTRITRFKLRDPQGNIYGVSLDAASNRISQENLEQIIRAIENKGFVSKLEAELAKRIAQKTNNPIRIVIYLKANTIKPDRGASRTEYLAYLNNLKSRTRALQQPLVNQLKDNNQQIIYQSLYTPVVVAAVTPAFIQTIAARSDVERIYLERQRSPRLDVSRVVY